MNFYFEISRDDCMYSVKSVFKKVILITSHKALDLEEGV